MISHEETDTTTIFFPHLQGLSVVVHKQPCWVLSIKIVGISSALLIQKLESLAEQIFQKPFRNDSVVTFVRLLSLPSLALVEEFADLFLEPIVCFLWLLLPLHSQENLTICFISKNRVSGMMAIARA